MKVGSILPDESYESKQSGMSRAELEHALHDAQADLISTRVRLGNVETYWRHAEDEFSKLLARHDILKKYAVMTFDRISELANNLAADDGWPFCSKKKMVEAIRKALSS